MKETGCTCEVELEGADPVADARQLANILIRQPSFYGCVHFLLFFADGDVLQHSAPQQQTHWCP